MSWVVDIVMAVIQLRDHLPWDNQHEQGILVSFSPLQFFTQTTFFHLPMLQSPMLHSIFNTWLGPNVCPFRLIGMFLKIIPLALGLMLYIGDLSLALSGPWLLYRIASNGTSGV